MYSTIIIEWRNVAYSILTNLPEKISLSYMILNKIRPKFQKCI